jgi:HAD superfamily hydrolase (TIGR01509 family)
VSASSSDNPEKIAILDIDGTLVDTNYQHAIAWYRAFRQHGIVLPVWRIHRHIGMGGDQVIAALTGERTEREQGDEIRATESDVYKQLIGEVETMEASRELIEQLKRRGHTVILASSAKDWEVDHYLDLLGARELADGWTTSADVQATKPEPDLVNAALKRAGQDGRDAVMVGDTPWDVRAASNAGVPTVAVLTGGFAIDELTESGAEAVFESVAELCSRLGQTSLG